MENKNNKDSVARILSFFSVVFAISGLVIIILFLGSLSKSYTVFGGQPLALTETGQVGDFIGGVVGALWSFTGVLLFYLSLRLQRKEFELQRDELSQTREEFKTQNNTLRLQRFENTFFNLISLHHQIVNSIDFDIYEGKKYNSMSLSEQGRLAQELNLITLNGRDVFKYHYNQFRNKVYVTDNLENTMKKYMEYWELVQTDFGHYFRNLYRIVKIVNETEFYTYEELRGKLDENSNEYNTKNFEVRYRYISMLRAQLSDYELLWLFYNCLSDNGSEKFKPLVEKFSLLKNMPKNKLIASYGLGEYTLTAFEPVKDRQTTLFDLQGAEGPDEN